MATIKAIDGHSIHQIQSGQVIVDLKSVIKELVENSLDAGASSIEVRFKNYGLDSIEIIDNGKGIAPEDFATVALKHHTSKLSNFEDLTALDTFGFRGEALSSLCAVSKLHVVTARAQDGAVGKRLDFKVSGELAGTTVTAAQKGTTVVVSDLFHNLPVRRKDLEKNLKRYYGNAIDWLHAYACISVGVRFAVSNQPSKGKKIAVFSTMGNSTTKENIVNVFGAKTLSALIPLNLRLEMEPTAGTSTQSARNWSTQPADRSMLVEVQGHISRPVFGDGRQAPDRQMFFVNSRPCGLPQIAKAMNDVYKSFNISQSAFIFANLLMDTNSYDVNVSPDKRTIMLHDQTALLESLKSSLTRLFEKTHHTVPQSTLSSRKLPTFQPLSLSRQTSSFGNGTQTPSASESGSSSPAEVQRDTMATSLIDNWIGRDTETRRTTAPARPAARSASKPSTSDTFIPPRSVGLAKDTSIDSRRRSMVSDEDSATEDGDDERRTTSSTGDADILEGIGETPRIPQDVFGKSSTDQKLADDVVNAAPRGFVSARDLANANNQALEDQGAIPVVTPGSQKSTPGPVQSAFDRMRPKRTPLQTAEITVGDHTTTTLLGTGSAFKKRRIHNPANSQAIANFGASPLLARGLRSFAAPGTQLDDAADDGNLENEDASSPVSNPDVDDASHSDGSHASAQSPPSVDEAMSDAEYIDEEEKKIAEDKRVARLIQEAEDAAARPSLENTQRAAQLLNRSVNRKGATLNLACTIDTSVHDIRRMTESHQSHHPTTVVSAKRGSAVVKEELGDTQAEQKLSLTVSKADFEQMSIIGQFNLGFILAVRQSTVNDGEDELFIIDQHAADEKYNYERFRRTVVIENQRLVRTKPLELTAVDEEVILSNPEALKANGFEIEMEEAESEHERRTFHLVTLPIAGQKTFDMSDLEELLHLLGEMPTGSKEIPRPRKVQRMLAMRACRSSIMVGKTLTQRQMEKVVRHMGKMEKPWNCPHGRPTMRHLAGLGAFEGWQEGHWVDEDGTNVGGPTDWRAYLESSS